MEKPFACQAQPGKSHPKFRGSMQKTDSPEGSGAHPSRRAQPGQQVYHLGARGWKSRWQTLSLSLPFPDQLLCRRPPSVSVHEAARGQRPCPEACPWCAWFRWSTSGPGGHQSCEFCYVSACSFPSAPSLALREARGAGPVVLAPRGPVLPLQTDTWAA